MKGPTSNEYFALIVASLVLLIVLIVSFMCIQLHVLKKLDNSCDAGTPVSEAFLGELHYTPSCGSTWLNRRRRNCHGLSTGAMPSIETDGWFGATNCCGHFGVPP